MIRQLNVKRQLTIPAPLAKRFGFTSKSLVDISEKNGVIVITPVRLASEGPKALALSAKDWQAFNHKVQAELRAGKGKVHETPEAFLRDLKRRMK